MIFDSTTPTRARAVQADAYPEDFAFLMPRPFNEFNCASLAEDVGANAAGLAHQLNQVLAENLGNNLAQRIKQAVAYNIKAEAEGTETIPLPDQATLNEMAASYDFTGIRSRGVSESSMTALEKVIYAYARNSIRSILKEQGYEGIRPCKVAKKDTEAGPGEISYDLFESLVEDLAEGNGVWAESEAHANARAELIEMAELEYSTRQRAAAATARSLTV